VANFQGTLASAVLRVNAGTEHIIAVGEVPGISMGHCHIQSPAEPEDFGSSSKPLPDGPPSEYRVSKYTSTSMSSKELTPTT
jgi:hypothetical protein